MTPKITQTSKKSGADLDERLSRIERDIEMVKKTIVAKKTNNHKKNISWISTILIVISAMFFVFAIVGFWLKTNIVNTDVWVSKTSEVIQNPNVRNNISRSLSDAIFSKVDVDTYVSDLLPDKAKPLALPISSSIEDFTQQQINKTMQAPVFIYFWEKINRQAHAGLVNSLQKANTNSLDNDNLLYFSGDKMMLNINPIYSNVRDKLSAKGLTFVNNVTPNQINKQIQVAEVQQMPAVLFAFNTISRAALLMIIPMILFGVGGFLLSPNRRKGLMIFASSSIALLVLNVQAVYLAQHPFMSGLNNAFKNSNNISAQAIFDIYTRDLIYYNRVAIVLMLVLLLFAFLAGPAKLSVWLRTQISKIFESKYDSPFIIWLNKNTNYIILGLLIVTFGLTIFPLINSIWFILTLFIVVGILCILLLSLKNGVKPTKKKRSKK